MSWALELWYATEPPVRIAEVFPARDSVPAGAVVENATYWWRVHGSDFDAYDLGLTVNGTRLQRDTRAADDVWFRWQIGYNAGFVDLELTGAGTRFAHRLQVDPKLEKLTRHEYVTMLRDLFEDTKSLANTSGFRQPVTRGAEELPIARVEFVLESAAALERLIDDLNHGHRKRLTRTAQTTPIQQARRLTGRDWARSSRTARQLDSAEVSALPEPLRGVVAAAGGRLPERIRQTNVLLDSARREHAEVLGLLNQLADLMGRVRQDQSRLRPDARDGVLLARCTALENRLRRWSHLPVFSGLLPARGAWRPSRLYENTHPYRELHRLHLDLRRGLGGIDGEFTRIPLRETYNLYETWVAVRLVRAAKLIDPSLSAAQMFRDDLEENRLTFSMAATSVAFLGRSLRFKPVYREVWRSTDRIGSYTHQMIPDVTLEFLSPAAPAAVLILDAKYRVGTALNDAISSIHMYRDAIVSEGGDVDRPQVERVVRGGFLITPRMRTDDAPWPADWRSQVVPEVLFRRGYQNTYDVGAIELRPGTSTPALARVLVSLSQRLATPALD